MRAKDKSNLVKVGFFVTLLTVVLMIMITAIGKENGVFNPKAIIRAQVTNAENLKPGAVVELRGLRIGFVEDIQIIGQETVEITLKVNAGDLRWVRQDSKVSINNAGLVGDKLLSIVGGSEEGGKFDPDKHVLYSEPSLDLKAIAAKGGSIADKADRVLSKVEVLVEAINPEKLNLAIDGMARTADNMGRATGPLAQTVQKLDSAAGKLSQVMERVQKGPGTANSLIYDDALYGDLRKLLGGAERNTVIKYFIRESIKKAPTEEK